MGHKVCQRSVCNTLYKMGYSLQANRKTQEGKSHPDRNEQFEYINEKVNCFQRKKPTNYFCGYQEKRKYREFQS